MSDSNKKQALPANPFTRDAETMRRFGYRVIDMLVDDAQGLARQPVGGGGDWDSVWAALNESPPAAGVSDEALFETLEKDVFANTLRVNHRRFYGYVPAPGGFTGAMAETLAAGFNIFAGVAPHNAGPTAIEMVTLRWLCEMMGLGPEFGGLFVSGGSVANLTALAAARQRQLDNATEGAIAYCTEHSHSSLWRAMKILGFAESQISVVPAGPDFAFDCPALETAIAADRAAGRTPFCVLASAGTTDTGAIDPLDDLADICARHELWLHVDGAFGAAAAITTRGRQLLGGLERADSLSVDPHKWLFQPIDCGCVLLRDPGALVDTFRILPPYMKDNDSDETLPNFRDLGIEVTRGLRALKLWMSIKRHGANAFRQAIERGMALVDFTRDILDARPCWSLVTRSGIGVAVFRYRAPGLDDAAADRLNRRIVGNCLDIGLALLSTTEIKGRVALRLSPINPAARRSDIVATLDSLEEFARRILDQDA